jgi:hypothetical protein
MNSTNRNFLVYCAWGVALAALTVFLFSRSINAFVEARVNTSGGYVPVYAGRGENREWVDDELVGPERYRGAKHREGVELSILSVVAGIASILCFIEGGRPQRDDRRPS